jgi:hypothetical protein
MLSLANKSRMQLTQFVGQIGRNLIAAGFKPKEIVGVRK